jgi:hypothetical protein
MVALAAKASLNMEKNTILAIYILDKYYKFLSVFKAKIAITLLSHRSFSHRIDLKVDEQLP